MPIKPPPLVNVVVVIDYFVALRSRYSRTFCRGCHLPPFRFQILVIINIYVLYLKGPDCRRYTLAFLHSSLFFLSQTVHRE